MNSIQHLDYDVLNTLQDIMEDNFTLLIETFIQDSTDRLAQLNVLINTRPYNSDAIRRAAHSFKGSCSNLGATYLTSLCQQLEQKALSGNYEGADIDLYGLQEEFSHVKRLLIEYLNIA